MGKRKSGSTYVTDDENDDGWLSTRNKKKISPPPMKMPGRQYSLRRAVSHSPLVLLMDDGNLQLMSAKKQTSIGDFFTSRLKPLSSADSTVGTPQHHASVQHITAEDPEDENSAMYADFDMPPATPSQVFTQSAISCGSETKRVSTPSSPGFDSIKYSCPSYSDSCHDEKSADTTSCTIQSCSGEVCSTHVLQRADNTSCTQQSCPGEVCSTRVIQRADNTSCSLQSCSDEVCLTHVLQRADNTSCSLQSCSGEVCLTHVQQREDGRKKRDAGEGRYSSYCQSQAGPGEFPGDSLHTPDFLKGGYDTVSTEGWSGDPQPVKVQTPGSGQGVKRKRNLSHNSDDDWCRGSYKTEQTTSLTEMSSLHFTEYHSNSLSLDVSANTPRVPLGVSVSTPRVQLDVSANTPRVPLDVSVSTPRVPLDVSVSTPRVPLNVSVSTPIVPLDISVSTRRVPLDVSVSTPRVPLDVSVSTPRVPLDVLVSTPRVPRDVLANTPRVPLDVSVNTPRVPLGVSANTPRVPQGVSVSAPRIPQQLCRSVHSVTAQQNPSRSSHHGVDSCLKGRELCGDSLMTPVFSSKSNCDSLPRDDESQLYSRHKPTCVYTTRGEELRSDSLMTPTFSNKSVRDYLPVDNDPQYIIN